MTATEAFLLVVGQEVVCSDGHGRVVRVERGAANSATVYVDTYIANRRCGWDSRNVSLPPR